MGRISEIPKLKAALAQRMEQLNSQGVGMSDKTAVTAGLMTPDEFSKHIPRSEDAVFRDLVEMVKQRSGHDDAVDAFFRSMRASGPADHSGMNCRNALTEPVEVNRHLLAENERLTLQVSEWARTYEQQMSAARATLEKVRAENRDLREKNPREVEMIAARAELDRLRAFVKRTEENVAATLDENVRLKAELRKRTTRFDPASRREEPWDPVAELEQVGETLFRSLSSTALMRRYEGYTLKGAIEKVVADLSVAEARLSGLPTNADPAECAAFLGLKAVKVEPGMLLAIREPGPDSPAPQGALKRMANALLSELTKRFGSMTYGAPTVLCIPHGASLEAVPTNGRGPVQVTIVPEGRPVKPTDCPKHVARAYAEAAAASYGVTPEVVRAKRRARRPQATVTPVESPFITPEVRAERRPLGQPIGWEDPDDLMLADAEV